MLEELGGEGSWPWISLIRLCHVWLCFVLRIRNNPHPFVFHKSNAKMKHMSLYMHVIKVKDIIFVNTCFVEIL